MITIRLKEIAEQRRLNLSQVQRGAQLDMGLVRRYWHNQTTSVDLRALERIVDFLNLTGMPITVGDLFAITQEPQP
jgi:hypothetical protein